MDVIEVAEEVLPVPIGQHSIYLSSDPMEQLAEAQARAAVLVEVITKQGLSKSFGGGKPHVFVEGWTFLASQFGLIPEVEWTRELEDGWEARAALRRMSDGQIVSHADAECRREESNWKKRDSYAIRSMAQTRAVSKVCRISLSSVMVMAGFSATPAEEMDGIKPETPKSPSDPHCPACLQSFGVLVAVTQHDKKPFWRCTASPQECGGYRTWNGKEYSWSGWHESWENSVADWSGGVVSDEAKVIDVTPDPLRGNHHDHILTEIMALGGIVSVTDAQVLVKPGLLAAIKAGSVDAVEALGGKPSKTPTDDELRTIYANLTPLEAEHVIAAAVQVANERPFDD